jgi:hypothetical protein
VSAQIAAFFLERLTPRAGAGSGDGFLKRVTLKQEEPFRSAQYRAFRDLAEGFVSDNMYRLGNHYYCLLDGAHFSSEAAAVAHFKVEPLCSCCDAFC